MDYANAVEGVTDVLCAKCTAPTKFEALKMTLKGVICDACYRKQCGGKVSEWLGADHLKEHRRMFGPKS